MDSLSDPDPPAIYKSFETMANILMITIVVLLMVVASIMLRNIWFVLRSHIVFRFENDGHHRHQPSSASTLTSSGVIRCLPVFVYSSGTNPDAVDCAVCLLDLEEGETGRDLPKCNHRFHVECIDMWFLLHSTCPLCRAPVELPVEPGSSFESPSSEHRKPMGMVDITLEVPSGSFGSGLDDDDSVTSTPTQFQSPLRGMLSFTRMLSQEHRT